MNISNKQSQLINLFSTAAASGINYQQVEDDVLNNEFITLGGKPVYNFGNCGYLALERDERVKEGAIEYIKRYGINYPSSRSFAALKVLTDIEAYMGEIFEKPMLLLNTTTLCHLAAIPVLTQKNDLILTDKQVHKTVMQAVMIAKAQGTDTEAIAHNNIDLLEEKIKLNAGRYSRIWFMADSIYSMFGDAAPLEALYAMLDKYDNFYLYIDDAHGMSWTGKNGAGFMRSKINWHDKLILATSFQKGFGAHGAGLILPDTATRDQVKYLGSSFIFNAPPPPATLGAIAASAKIHMSSEITVLQKRLSDLMEHFVTTCRRLNLPLVSASKSPVFFIGLGEVTVSMEVARLLINEGYFVNCCAYPAVPLNNDGLRITVSLHHNKEGITHLLHAIAAIFEQKQLSTQEVLSKYRTLSFAEV
jgi:7-keto-8-aminopelargonate synthetase-like enzyme